MTMNPIEVPEGRENRPPENAADTAGTPEGASAMAQDLTDTASSSHLPVTDLAALAHRLARMNRGLEKIWSDALDTDSVRDALAEQDRVWAALGSAIRLRANYDDQLTHAEGKEPTVLDHGFPLPISAVSSLPLDPTDDQRRSQLAAAMLYALADYTAAAAAMRNPTARGIVTATGDMTSWWESGGFSLVWQLAQRLARVADAAADVSSESTGGGEIGPHMRRAREYLQLASRACAMGMDEAAVVYAHCALKSELAGIAGVEEHSVPPITRTLAGLAEFREAEGVCVLIESVTERLGRGESVDLGVVVPLAMASLMIVERALRVPFTATSIKTIRERIRVYAEGPRNTTPAKTESGGQPVDGAEG